MKLILLIPQLLDLREREPSIRNSQASNGIPDTDDFDLHITGRCPFGILKSVFYIRSRREARILVGFIDSWEVLERRLREDSNGSDQS